LADLSQMDGSPRIWLGVAGPIIACGRADSKENKENIYLFYIYYFATSEGCPVPLPGAPFLLLPLCWGNSQLAHDVDS
jgi:hypothetical protein